MRIPVLLSVICIFVNVCCGDENLYKVLGVRKTASQREIKSAYRKLALEWHPDKNTDPGAKDRFIKINEAYETLSDKEKRSQYDQFGTTSAQVDPNRRGGGQGFDSFFSREGPFGGFQFNFGGGRDSTVDKHRINLKIYESKILPESNARPFLLYAYSDFCYQCMQVEMIWDRVVQDLDTIGMGVGTIHVQVDRRLATKLRISSIPSIIGIVDGKTHWMQRNPSVANVREFVRSFFPKDMITKLNDKNYKDFLNGWKDNRVRLIFFDNRPEPSLRFTLAAFAYRDHAATGYVNYAGPGADALRHRFGVHNDKETLLIFNEDVSAPFSHISMKTLPRKSIDEMIETNKYLILPRISNQDVFNEVCPAYSGVRKKKLCVVLLTKNGPAHDLHRQTFREYAHEQLEKGGRASERVKHAYMYEDTQSYFVSHLTQGKGALMNDTTGTLKVAVLWRRDDKKINYDFLEEGWYEKGEELLQSKVRLSQMVTWILRSSELMPHNLDMIHDLIDENAQALYLRMYYRLGDWYDLLWEKFWSIDEITLITLGTTLAFVVVIGVMMRSMITMEEAEAERQYPKRQQPRQTPRGGIERPTVYLHPLCSDNFEKIVCATEPGVRTIVILVSEESKEKLLQNFATSVHQYSRSDAFNFGFVQLEHYLPWYRHLLEETLDFKRDLKTINIKNCIGTVLAINGPRKYYCVYHASSTKLRAKSSLGSFMGMAEGSESDWSTDSDGDEKVLFEGDLLRGLSTWMERLCEGQLKRFRVQYWPPMTDPS